MKTRTKSIIALMIALFAVLIIGATKVNAVEVTDEVWNSIPNEISVNIKESEHKKANDIVKSQILEILKGKGVTATTEDINAYINNTNIREVQIHIGNKNKTMTVVYSNSAEYNKSEQQKVDNIVKGINKTFIVTTEFNTGNSLNIYNETEKKVIEPLTKAGYITTNIGGAGAGGSNFILTGESRFEIYKNEVYYGYIDIQGKVQDKITVPTDIEESEVPQYITDKLNKSGYFKEIKSVTKSNEEYYVIKGTQEIKWENGETGETGTTLEEFEEQLLVKREGNSTINKEDKTTGIKLETTTAVVPNNTILSSVTVTEQKTLDTVNKALKDTTNKYKVYDINLLKDGAKIQPNGKVKISIPIPNDYNKSKLEVYRIDSNGAKTKYNVTVNGEYASFETDHFSIYVLADATKSNSSNNQGTTNNDRELDETPKTGIQDITYIITAVVIISAVGIIATIKRKQSKH